MRLAIFTLSLLFGLSAIGQTFAVRISTNTTLAQGDQVIWSGSAWVTYGKGTNGQVLTMDGTNVVWATPSGGGGGGSGTVTSVGASTTVSGLGFSGSPVTASGTLSLTGTVAVASGGTGATDASGARTALSLVPGTDVQAYDADLAAVAALANSGIIVRTGAGTVSARTITGDSEAVVSNGDGVSGNPTLSIGSAIARDAEVASSYAPLASPAFTTSATIGGTNILDYAATHLTEVEASALYQRTNANLTTVANLTGGTSTNFLAGDGTFKQVTTNMVPGLNAILETIGGGSGSDTNWNGTPISSGTITNLTTSAINLGGQSRTAWPAASTRKGEHISSPFISGQGLTAGNNLAPYWGGGALASGTIAFPSSAGGSLMGDDVSYLRAVSSSSANGGYYYSTRPDMFVLTTNDWTAFYFRPVATNDTVVFSRLGWQDSITTTAPVDGLYISRNGSVLSLIARSNSTETASATTYTIASNTTYWGMITLKDSSGTFAADLTISNSTTLLSTMSVTGNIPNTFSRLTGHGVIAWSTNAVAVNLEDWGYMEVYNQLTR